MLAEIPGALQLFQEWWPLLVMVSAALGAFYRVFKNGMKNMLEDIVEYEIKPIQEQFQNNGGSTLKDAVDRMAVGLQESNEKADTGLGMARETNDRVVSVAAEMAQRVAETNQSVASSIGAIQKKLDATADQMHLIADQRTEDTKILNRKIDQVAEQVTVSTAKMHTVTANLRAAYFEVDADVKMVYCNDSFLELLGITYNEAMSGNFDDLIAEEDRSKVQRAGLAALENKVEWISDFTVVRKDGKRIKVVVRAYPIWDGENFGGYTGALVEVGS